MLANVVLDFFLKGGPVMWPILLCLIAALVVMVERALWWWQLERETNSTLNECFDTMAHDFDAATELTETEGLTPYLRTVREKSGARAQFAPGRHATPRLRRNQTGAESRQWVLGTFPSPSPRCSAAPRRVIGIMHSFSFVGDRQLASNGQRRVSEALIATACGLGIAMLCLLPTTTSTGS